MSKECKNWVSGAGRVLLALAIVISQSALAGQNPKTTDKANSPQQTTARVGEKQFSAAPTAKRLTEETQGEESEGAVAAEKPAGDGSHEGIKVHGHWTIEVRNADGSLVSHREFENSLAQGASTSLLSILTGQVVGGTFAIQLFGTGGPCFSSKDGPHGCLLSVPGQAVWPIGNITGGGGLDQPLVSGNSLLLSGHTTAMANGDVSSVVTELSTCDPAHAVGCANGAAVTGGFFLTGTTASAANPNFSTPIQVSVGQIIAVTVIISFS